MDTRTLLIIISLASDVFSCCCLYRICLALSIASLLSSSISLSPRRMTADLMPPEMAAALSPNCVVPVGAYLVHEECPDNGVVVETGAGWAGKTRLQRSKVSRRRGDVPHAIPDGCFSIVSCG